MMEKNQLIRQIIATGKKLYAKNLTFGTSGNITIRDESTVYITTSGSALADLDYDDVAMVDLDGNVLTKNKPSSELPLHLEVYKKRPDLNSLIHVHAPKTSVFAVCNHSINKPILSEAIYSLGEIQKAQYDMPSSDALAKNTAKCFDNGDIVLMQNHGVIVGAENLSKAFYKTETLEIHAQIMLNCLLLGDINELSTEEKNEFLKHILSFQTSK